MDKLFFSWTVRLQRFVNSHSCREFVKRYSHTHHKFSFISDNYRMGTLLKFNSSPLKIRLNPKGKDHLPTIHFSICQLLNFGGVKFTNRCAWLYFYLHRFQSLQSESVWMMFFIRTNGRPAAAGVAQLAARDSQLKS